MTDNSGKIILDLCGGTGAWSKPYRDAGYDVRLVTLPDNDVLTYDPPADVYGILAAPPCTEFSVAKNGSRRKRDLALGMETVRACQEIIWKCQTQGKLTFWAMENPRGLLRRFMGKPAMTFDPWQYGDGWTKKTDLWGYFNPPKPTVTVQPEGLTRRYANDKSNAFCWTTCNDRVPDWYTGPKLDRAGRRAITPPGFAKAFYRANK
ncbi:hypothetical protein CAFE_18560 [Caprobacter fermentans]|uniref:DNA cytosine methyltransferase n=1 Tax=Caproicibacter fermentans TaxID=2576756 RepID=A0A6N8HZ80_9FIRM|nr:hypothetical protein [Caproicibacter fermentans]MVB11151.1 hypothetical protein [Caproicibacter fermentans]